MKISIITVCYNSAITLETTIKSVIAQSYNDIEYIVIDGGSTDATLDLIKKYDKYIAKFISEPDNGLYDAMNKGVAMATGDVVGLINSDDLFCDNNALKKVADIFLRDATLDSVYADLYYVSQTNTDKIVRKWVTGNKRKFKYGWHPAHPTFYIKKKIYDMHGLFDLTFSLAADFELMLRFLDRYNISTEYLKEPLVKMRLGGETNKSFKNIINQNSECIRAFKENGLAVNNFLYPLQRLAPKFIQFINKR
jgi:glycosyltransferase involved in cell wall biosynthesis